jgi:hypothetical protein
MHAASYCGRACEQQGSMHVGVQHAEQRGQSILPAPR